NCEASYNGISLNPQPRMTGNSIVAHEVSHAIHSIILTEIDKEIIEESYNSSNYKNEIRTACEYIWIHGNEVEDQYSYVNDNEYFARLAEVYLGVKNAESPTGLNGKAAVLEIAPDIYQILQRVYGNIDISNIIAP